MSQPTPYERQYSFTQYQAQFPTKPLPANQIDAEFDAIKATLDELLANLKLIQRDDGQLASASVGADQFKPEVSVGVSPAVPWAATTFFAVNATVFYTVQLYRCITAHTSGVSFDSTKFVLLADLSSIAIPPGSVGTTQLAANAVTTAKIADGNVTPTKIGGLTGSTILGRYSNTTGSAQNITVGSGATLNSSTGVVSVP